MAIAVSVMLFVAALAWFAIALSEKEPIAIIMFLVSVAGGVLNIVLPIMGIQIAVGVLAFVEAIWCAILLIWIIGESGLDDAIGVMCAIGAFLLFAWAVVFGILQLTIVV